MNVPNNLNRCLELQKHRLIKKNISRWGDNSSNFTLCKFYVFALFIVYEALNDAIDVDCCGFFVHCVLEVSSLLMLELLYIRTS